MRGKYAQKRVRVSKRLRDRETETETERQTKTDRDLRATQISSPSFWLTYNIVFIFIDDIRREGKEEEKTPFIATAGSGITYVYLT